MAEKKQSIFSSDQLLSVENFSKTSLLNTPNSLFMGNSTTSEEQYLPSDEKMLELIFQQSPIFTKAKMWNKIDNFAIHLNKSQFSEEACSYDDVQDKGDLLSTKIQQLNLSNKEKQTFLEKLNSLNQKKM